ncbi:dynein regulatory complex protein 9-like [Ischnura elegans]|uniref:dynein regulatory complex protein 9-like n=1 Tax=Ischnura elegans TaxID=197161 RepID=UPI001ED868A4|nr:dynein regulatory complex protein 9-like [Ischnura elegans]XP_046392746.1 dynein regulatory complex protein 9-like [Ischnura elegans]
MGPLEKMMGDVLGLKLTEQQTIFVIAVLDDTINQLSILRHHFPGCARVSNLEYTPLRKRLGIDERERIFEKSPDVSNHQSTMLGNECAYLEVVFRKTMKELMTSGSFTTVSESLEVEAQLQEDLVCLGDELESNLKEVERLMNSIVYALQEQKKGQKLKFEAILAIKNQVHDLLMMERLCASVMAKWEHARQDLNKKFLGSIEGDAQRRSDFLQKSLTTEMYTHAQYSTALEKMIADLENDITTWTKKREVELDEKEQQILNLKIERSRNQRHLEELKEEYESRQGEIDDFLAYKKAKQERIELEILQAKMATRIQAWWKGILLRKKLRAKKKKGKKGGKGKKKKGKGKKKKGKKKP